MNIFNLKGLARETEEVRVPALLKGIVLPKGSVKEIQARVDKVHEQILALNITGMHWMNRGMGSQGPTLEIVESQINSIDISAARREGRVIEGKVVKKSLDIEQ